MSKSSPPEPPPLKFDDCLAVFVAFTTVNSLLYYWALNQKNYQFSFKKFRFSPPDAQANAASKKVVAYKPTTNAPESIDLGFTQTNFSTPKSKSQGASFPGGNLREPAPQNPTLPESSSLSDRTPSKTLSKPQAPEENTSLESAIDIAVASPTPTAPTPTPGVEFSDVPDGSWANRFIESLHQRNIVTGLPDRRFQPNKFATRAELAVLLQKVFDQENTANASNFKDLPANYWASDAIKKVSTTGLLKGYAKQDFRPDQPVTRAEVLVALATALKLKTPSSPDKTLQVFQDSDQVLDYAIAKVAAAKEAGLVAGYPKDKILVPNKPATRAEMAAMFYQALAISGKEEKISSRF
jgi:hypothetical protein